MRFGNRLDWLRAYFALGHVTAKLFPSILHVLDFSAVIRRTVEGRVVQFLVGNRNSETRAEHAQLIIVEFFLLVSNVLAFAGFSEAVAFNGFREHYRRRSVVLNRCFISGMNLNRVMAAQ